MIRQLILGTPLEPLARFLARRPARPFASGAYWESRYKLQGTSGSGSYGRLAAFKAAVLNDFVASNNIKSVIEFGCGDGNQLSLANYPEYIGVDVSETAVANCRERFRDDPTKQFKTLQGYRGETAELALSLDVIYHLVEDAVYESYLRTLFTAGTKFVVIYSSNYAGPNEGHVMHRRFTNWCQDELGSQWKLVNMLPNRFPYDEKDPDNTSLADFYFFTRSDQLDLRP